MFDKECEEFSEGLQIDGITPRNSPINESGKIGIILTTIRLYTIEYILSSLFIFDEFKFSNSFLDDEILIDYISFRIQNDLKRMGFYDDFESEMLKVYAKFVKDHIIFPFSKNALELASVDSKTSNVRQELKILVKEELKKSLKRISEIIGIDETKESSLKDVFFEGLDIFDTFSDFGTQSEELQYTSVNSRFSEMVIPNNGKFILERYIKVNKPSVSLNIDGLVKGAIVLEQNKSPFINRDS